MPKWEYLFLECDTCRVTLSWRPRSVNGVELRDWKSLSIHGYCNDLGNEGWELITVDRVVSNEGGTSFLRFIFKRPQWPEEEG
jgi:hypothetical protein